MSEIKVKKHRRKWEGTEIFSVIMLTLLALLILVPFWNALVISLETAAAYGKAPFSWLPGEWTLENYEYLFMSSNALAMGYKGTLIVIRSGSFFFPYCALSDIIVPINRYLEEKTGMEITG